MFLLHLTSSGGFLFSTENNDVRVTHLNDPTPGYLFLGPLGDVGTINLFDNALKSVYKSNILNESEIGSFFNFKILSNGEIVAYSIPGNKWYFFDEEFRLKDSLSLPEPYINDMHEIISMPNNRYGVLGMNYVTYDMSKIVANGQEDATIVDFVIIECDKNGNIYYSWSFLENVPVTQTTEDVDLTQKYISPYHVNSLFYDKDGNIIASARFLDQVIKINWSSGAIMWQMGGSKSRKNDFTFIDDTENGFTGFSHQHHAQRLSNGNLLLFDNGNLKSNPRSRVVEYSINENNLTAKKVWEYKSNPAIFSHAMGSVSRLSSGNTLIGWGGGEGGDHQLLVTEVTSNGSIAFQAEGPMGFYRAFKHVIKSDVVEQSINSTGSYNFNNAQFTTGVKFNVTYRSSTGPVTVEKHRYKPHTFKASGLDLCVKFPVRWMIQKYNIDSLYGSIYIDVSSIPNFEQSGSVKIYRRNKENEGDFVELATVYNSQLKRLEADCPLWGEFATGILEHAKPFLSMPENMTKGVSINPTLSWGKLDDDEKFDFILSSSEDFSVIVKDTVNFSNNQLQITNLNYSTTYYWKVKLRFNGCESPWSDVYEFTTVIASPELIVPANGTRKIPLAVQLKWTGLVDAEACHLQIARDSNFVDRVYDNQLNGDVVSFTYNNLEHYTQYFWRVRASNASVWGAWSKVYSFETAMSPAVLSYPLNNTRGIRTRDYLRWQPVKGATLYTVELSTDPSFMNSEIERTGVTTNEFRFRKLNYLTVYYWRVHAANDYTENEWSEVWSFRTTMPAPIMDNPIIDYDDNSIKAVLSWSSVEEAFQYEFELAEDSSFAEIKYHDLTYNTFLLYSNLENDRNYYIRVRAVNKDFMSDWSRRLQFKTIKKGEIATPMMSSPTNDSYSNPLSIELKWQPINNVDFVFIELSDNLDFENAVSYQIDAGFSSINIENLEYNKTYYWRLQAEKDGKKSEWSLPWSFTTKLAPTNLISPSNYADDIELSPVFEWEPVEGALFYELQVAKDPDFLSIVYEADNLNETNYHIKKLNYETDYFWRVKAKNEYNYGENSETYTFKTLVYVSVHDNDFNLIKLYPNPASDIVYLSITDRYLNGVYEIVNSLGQSLLRGDIYERNIPINLSRLSSGIYFIKIFGLNTTTQLKINISK